MTRRRRGGIKMGESKLASNQFPKWSSQPKHPERFTELNREEKGGREEIEVIWERKWRVKSQ